ncbi:MAG: carboxymuconolactone decarboxylase family protein [Caulobacteraceae bacterium]
MSRIPYADPDAVDDRALVEAILARRGGKLIDLDRMLLHSPALARGWNAHLGQVRTGLALPAKLRELAILAVAVINGADYEFEQHQPVFIGGGGTAAQVEALRDIDRALDDTALFDASERAVLALAVEMTRDVTVSDAAFHLARRALGSDQAVVEMVGVVATYNMVSRFLVALGV